MFLSGWVQGFSYLKCKKMKTALTYVQLGYRILRTGKLNECGLNLREKTKKKYFYIIYSAFQNRKFSTGTSNSQIKTPKIGAKICCRN